MVIDDIQGTRPTKPKEYGPREVNKVDDIPGAVKKEPAGRKTLGAFTYDSISYNDVTRKQWQSKRCSNPLDPVYVVSDARLGDFTRRP